MVNFMHRVTFFSCYSEEAPWRLSLPGCLMKYCWTRHGKSRDVGKREKPVTSKFDTINTGKLVSILLPNNYIRNISIRSS
jgi:hypothetical protein